MQIAAGRTGAHRPFATDLRHTRPLSNLPLSSCAPYSIPLGRKWQDVMMRSCTLKEHTQTHTSHILSGTCASTASYLSFCDRRSSHLFCNQALSPRGIARLVEQGT